MTTILVLKLIHLLGALKGPDHRELVRIMGLPSTARGAAHDLGVPEEQQQDAGNEEQQERPHEARAGRPAGSGEGRQVQLADVGMTCAS